MNGADVDILELELYESIRSELTIYNRIEWKKTMELEDLLNEEGYFEDLYRRKGKNVQAFLDDINDAFVVMLDETGIARAESFIPKFIEFLVNVFASGEEEPLSVESFQSSLAYKEDNRFYHSILQFLTDKNAKNYLLDQLIDTEKEDKYLTEFQSHLAGSYRRKGDLQAAIDLLVACEKRMESRNNGEVEYLKRLSLIEYELAYVYYVQGNGAKAYDFFGQSVDHAIEAGNVIGEWISRCLKYWIGFQFDISSLDELERVSIEALDVFERMSNNRPIAQRWAMNCWVYLSRVAHYRKDRVSAEKYHEIIFKSEWAAPFNFDYATSFKTLTPRLLFLQEKIDEAISAYRGYLAMTTTELKQKMEELQEEAFYIYFLGLAEHYYDLGNIHILENDVDEALRIFNLGLQVPTYGNVHFHRKIRDRVAEIG